MMKKLQKLIREKKNISEMSDMKITQSFKNFERNEKMFERI